MGTAWSDASTHPPTTWSTNPVRWGSLEPLGVIRGGVITAHRYLKSKKKRFEQIELQAKLLNYFLGSNKSNINQSGGGTVGGRESGRERAAQPTHKYTPCLSVAWAIMLFTLVSPSASSDAVRTSCCFHKLMCMSDSDAFPCFFWIWKKTVAGSVHSGHD